MCTSLMVSPLIVAICRRKSTRVMAAIGGLVTALGCLFTSFASQLHQVFLSYGAIIGNSSFQTLIECDDKPNPSACHLFS